MRRRRDEDLFASSTMSFGEHLEELRQALFRALTGLMVGFAIGLYVATPVVKFIQTPLEKALKQYFSVRAKEQLTERYAGKVPPEMMALVEQEEMVPEPQKIDPFGLLERLREDFPDQFGDLQFTQYHFVVADVKPALTDELGRVDDFARALLEAPKKELQGPVSQRLTAPQRATLTEIARRGKPTAEDRAAVVAILNELVDQPELREAYELQNEKGPIRLMRSELAPTIVQLDAQLNAAFDRDASRRLNRLVVAAAFTDYLRLPRRHLVQVTTWRPNEVRVQTLNPQEAFMIWLKAGLIAGAVISSPWIFWHIWAFVAAGLYRHERRFVWIFLPFSLGLFLAGASLAFFFVFEPVLTFLFSFNRAMNIDPDPRISEWIGFVLFLPLGFGIAFQLPLVMLFLHRIGIFTIQNYLEKWRIAILVICVLSAVLTPADPVSMLLLGIPLVVLYFGGIALCRWMPRSRSPFTPIDEV